MRDVIKFYLNQFTVLGKFMAVLYYLSGLAMTVVTSVLWYQEGYWAATLFSMKVAGICLVLQCALHVWVSVSKRSYVSLFIKA